MLGPQAKIFRTFDSGENWIQVSTIEGDFIQDICFVDSLTTYTCSASTNVYKSTDGGYTVGSQTILKTTNGGENWVLAIMESI